MVVAAMGGFSSGGGGGIVGGGVLQPERWLARMQRRPCRTRQPGSQRAISAASLLCAWAPACAARPRPSAHLHALPVLLHALGQAPDELQIAQAAHGLAHPAGNRALRSQAAAGKPGAAQRRKRAGARCTCGGAFSSCPSREACGAWSSVAATCIHVRACMASMAPPSPPARRLAQCARSSRAGERAAGQHARAHLCPLPMMPASRPALVSATIWLKRALSSRRAVDSTSPTSSNRSPLL